MELLGLQDTVHSLALADGKTREALEKVDDFIASRHITGQELSEGLRDFALMQWGMLARTVLGRWNIHRTEDFGRIVFLLIENGWLSKTEQDSEADFRHVFDFDSAFGQDYRIEVKP